MASILYVDDDAPQGGDGQSWKTAYRYLQDALAAAAKTEAEIDEIRVAQGTYWPDQESAHPTGSMLPEATFRMITGVDLRGSFAGLQASEGTAPNEQDFDQFPTTLSGLLGAGSRSFGVYNVVTASEVVNGTRLEGFIIRDGDAPLFEEFFVILPTLGGGGMIITASDVVMSACTFEDNQGAIGGSLHIDQSIVHCEDTIFSNSIANGGGGVLIWNDSTAMFIRCTIRDNGTVYPCCTPFGIGGGVSCSGAVTFRNCLFEGNQTEDSGGGLYVAGSANVLVESCAFVSNSVLGGLCVWGGAIAADATDAIGALSQPFHLVVVNSLFTGNFIESYDSSIAGAAVWAASKPKESSFEMYNCTITQNRLDARMPAVCSGAALVINEPQWVVRNCVIYNNESCSLDPDQSPIVAAEGFLPEHCLIENLPREFAGFGNIDADPLFVDPLGPDGVPGTGDEDFRLSAGSPAIDAADNTAVSEDITTDFDGNPRFVDDPATRDTGIGPPPIVDMGAYEFQVRASPADFDVDGDVDFSDLLLLLAAWGACPEPCPPDLDDSGEVEFGDFLTLLAAWS